MWRAASVTSWRHKLSVRDLIWSKDALADRQPDVLDATSSSLQEKAGTMDGPKMLNSRRRKLSC